VTQTLFTSQTPSTTNASDAAPGLTLGTCWYSNVDGYVTGIRWYFPATLPAVAPTALLYEVIDSGSGTELASTQFASPVAGQWNEVLFDDPVPVDADTLYIAAVWTPDRYVATSGFFTAADLVSGDLVAIQDATNPTGLSGNQRNGRFESGASPAYPTDFFGAASYFADVLFETSLTNDGALAGTLPALTAAFAGDYHNDGVLAGNLPALAAAVAGDQLTDGVLAGMLSGLTAGFAGDQLLDGALAGTLPALTGSFTDIVRPLVTRPNTGLVVRPDLGLVTRP
jgi:hypothetical protein